MLITKPACQNVHLACRLFSCLLSNLIYWCVIRGSWEDAWHTWPLSSSNKLVWVIFAKRHTWRKQMHMQVLTARKINSVTLNEERVINERAKLEDFSNFVRLFLWHCKIRQKFLKFAECFRCLTWAVPGLLPLILYLWKKNATKKEVEYIVKEKWSGLLVKIAPGWR